jgi:hypothetical protein
MARLRKRAVAGIVAAACVALIVGDANAKKPVETSSYNVPKAICGLGDHPETALQGQVPAALRAVGFKGFNCNLELIGQSRGEGANWQSAEFTDNAGHHCGYHGTASPSRSLPGRQHLGVPVVDLTDPTNPTPTAYLQTTSMLDPWESLKVNERRQLLGADNGQNGAGGPEVDIYDLSNDCRNPQLLASLPVGTGTDGGGVVDPIIGHEGAWAPDGLTYYGGDLRFKPPGATAATGQYYAVDTADPTHPKLITAWVTGVAGAIVHGMSISDDGNRGYFVSLKSSNPAFLDDSAQPAANGLLIYDLSDIQARKPNPQVRLISTLFWKDGATAQHTIPIKIKGKPYLVFVDEAGSGGNSAAGWQAACDAGMPAWPMARIIDIGDERNPTIISRLALEIHDPANCETVIPDLAGLGSFTYGSHYCSVDDRDKATTLACGYFNSGIRVFDIRDPAHPSEIAYYNPAGTTTASPGSNHATNGQWRPGGPDWCSAQVHLDKHAGTLWTTCQDNGVLMLKFTHGAWPLPSSKTPPGQQN